MNIVCFEVSRLLVVAELEKRSLFKRVYRPALRSLQMNDM